MSLWLPSLAVAQGPMERVAVEYRPPTLLVQARVNGREPMWFAFDTGATTCLIDFKAVQRLGLKPAQRPGREGPYFTRARTLAVGRVEARDLELVIRDLSPISQQVGREVAGIVGYTWMEQFVFEIDYGARRLSLWPRTVELTPPADELPVPLDIHSIRGFTGATPYVSAQLNRQHTCRMLLDTGTDLGILGRQMALQLGVDVNALGAAGERPRYNVRRLDFGGRVFGNVPFYVEPRRGADGNPYAQCIVGNEVLKEFVVTIDLARRRAFFRKLSPAPE